MSSLFLIWLTACGGVPLPEVPIVGGDEAQRAAARDELDTFERWVTPKRVELVEVRMENIEAPRENMETTRGYFDPPKKAIVLQESLIPNEIRDVLRHELCHAIDYQNRMLVRPDRTFDVWAEHVVSSTYLLDEDFVLDDERDMRGEVMAKFCEQGPSTSILMSTGCTASGERLHEVADWLLDQVWYGEPDLDESSAWEVTEVRGFWAYPANADVYTLDVLGARSQEAAWMRFGKAGVWDQVLLDLLTGESLGELSSDTTTEAVLAPIPPFPVGLQLPGIYEAGGTGARHVTDGETAVALAQGHLLEKFDTVLSQRILVHDSGDRWSIAGGLCLPDAPSSVFLANGRFYVAWAENGEIRWAEIVRTDGD